MTYDKSEVEGEASSSILSQEMDKEETGQKTSVNVHNNPQVVLRAESKILCRSKYLYQVISELINIIVTNLIKCLKSAIIVTLSKNMADF